MKKKYSILLIIVLITLVSCSKTKQIEPRIEEDPIIEPTIIMESVSISSESLKKIGGNNSKYLWTDFSLCLVSGGINESLTLNIYPENYICKEIRWLSSDETIAVVDDDGNVKGIKSGECEVFCFVDHKESNHIHVRVYDSSYYVEAPEIVSMDGLTYIDDMLIVNKTYALPSNYNPGGVIPVAKKAWQDMVAAAKKDGFDFWVCSDYRSYQSQVWSYYYYYEEAGQITADTYSAHAGHSEHQTGLAIDVNRIDYGFGEKPEGIWLANHAAEYGFIIRYPKGKQEETGYIYEPWHIRFVGTEKAFRIYDTGLCLEEYLGITSIYSEEEMAHPLHMN